MTLGWYAARHGATPLLPTVPPAGTWNTSVPAGARCGGLTTLCDGGCGGGARAPRLQTRLQWPSPAVQALLRRRPQPLQQSRAAAAVPGPLAL